MSSLADTAVPRPPRVLESSAGRGMRRVPRVVLLALVAALAVIAAGCGGDEAQEAPVQEAPAEEEVVPAECSASFGIMGPFTGGFASIGQEALNWGKFAVQRFNEENGTDFALVEGDTQFDPAQASAVAPQFVSNEDIVAVVGPAASEEVEAVGPIFDREGMAYVSASATRTDLTTSGKFENFFRVVANDDVQGPTDANYMVDVLGAKKVMIVDNRTSYSTGLSDTVQETLEAAGVEVQREAASTEQTDFSAIVGKITADTDVVFLPLEVAANAQLFAEQMAEQGKEAVIFGSDRVFSPYSDDFRAEGALVSFFAPDITAIDDPLVQELVEAFRQDFGDFGTFGPPTFVATQVLLEAANRVCQTGSEPAREAVLAEVEDTDIPDSILGQPITFDENGDVAGARFFIFQIKNGKYTLIQ